MQYAGVQSHAGGEERDGNGGENKLDPCQGKPGVDIITQRTLERSQRERREVEAARRSNDTKLHPLVKLYLTCPNWGSLLALNRETLSS